MDNNIYTGIWTNWSRGPIFGPTLTTTKEYGNLLIAFTALFVTFVASRLWRISCLILHRWYSIAADRSAIHHQRQVILRNSRSAESALFETLSLFWTWRKSGIQRVSCLVPLILLSACYLAAFTAAGGFSSNISSSIGDEVLINGQYCGILLPNATVDSTTTRQVLWISEQSNSAANYVQQCYGTNQSNTTTACNKFVRSSLSTQVTNTTAECPFQHQICRNPQATLRLDSGYIDSHDDLGLNAPKDERFAYRYVLHCSPLETDNYKSHVNEDGRGWDIYHYGSRPMGPPDDQTGFIDYIYKIEDLDSQYRFPEGSSAGGNNFKLSGEYLSRFRGESGLWDPIPELVRLDGDLTILFLSGTGVLFLQPTNDDWYRANTASRPIYYLAQTGSRPTWHPDVSASPMGCLEQFQWCNSAYPRDRGCGPLASIMDSIYGAAPFFNVANETLDSNRPSSPDTTRSRFIWPMLAINNYPTVLTGLLSTLATRSLASQTKFYSGIQSPLLENQWQLDVIQWWHDILAALQASRCFGLYFTFITGALIIIASYTLEPILNYLHRRRQHKSYAHLEWISNTSLQLHSMVHEQVMGQEWANCTDDIPTTDPDLFLANLDISDPEHPILRRPEVPKGKTEAVESSAVPADSPSFPTQESLHSDSAAHLNGRTSTSLSATSVSDGSWTLDTRTAIMNVSGQFSVEETQHSQSRGDTIDAVDSGGRAEDIV